MPIKLYVSSIVVLVKELQSLGLDVRLYSENNEELELKENIDEGIDINLEDDKMVPEELAIEADDMEIMTEDNYEGDALMEADEEDDDILFGDMDTDLAEDNMLEDNDMLDE